LGYRGECQRIRCRHRQRDADIHDPRPGHSVGRANRTHCLNRGTRVADKACRR
jgi:hypothetical protein